MQLDAVMERLEQGGTEQNRKIYKRHGVSDPMFGLSFSALKKLKKEVGTDHQLAIQLWETGNHDARMLACMVGDPREADRELLDMWAADLDNYILTDQFASFVASTGFARICMDDWTMDEREFVAAAGWDIVAILAVKQPELPDLMFDPWMALIERGIHDRSNRVRHAMNQALIAIGCRDERLRDVALAVARRIGKITVDHGETGCKTPDAAAYIKRTWKRKQQKK